MILEILAYANQPNLKDKIVIAASQGALNKGQVMARLTSSGQYVPVNTGASDGSQTPVGILAHDMPGSSSTQPSLMYFTGMFRKSKLTGLTAQAITNFGARMSDIAGHDLVILR